MNSKIIMIGGGGHAKVLCDILSQQKVEIYAVSSPKLDPQFSLFNGLKHILNDDEIYNFGIDEVQLVNGIGSIPGNTVRASVFDKFREYGYEFLSVISQSAIVSEFCKVGMGVQIMPGTIINADSVIGNNTIVNSGAIIEHDCIVGDNSHIAPGAVVCGGTFIGKNTHVGAGAVVIQGLSVGASSLIAAGAVVSKTLPKNSVVYPFRCLPEKKGNQNEL